MKKRIRLFAMLLIVLAGIFAFCPQEAYAATAPTKFWVASSETNNIPADIDLWRVNTGTNQRPNYIYQIYLPGNALVTQCKLSWDGGGTVTINGTTYNSGECPIPSVDSETSYTFKSGTTTLGTYRFIAYQGSPAVQAVFIEIDESAGHNTIAQMDASSDHSVECSGTIYINGAEYELTKMKGRGNATWSNSSDKKPYNITLGTKIKFPGIDSDKTKKWSLLAENLDRTLLGNRAGYYLAYEMGIGQDTTSADVWMNGEYQGCYTVTPKTDSFVTKNGFMIEQDNYKEDPVSQGGDPQFTLEGLKESSGWSSCYNRITVKKMGDNLLLNEAGEVDESATNLENVANNTIKPWLQDAWDAIRSTTGYNSKGKYYTDYIDIESFAKMYLMHEYVKSYDVCAGSLLYHRDGTGENDKLIAGPIWDLDNALGSTYQNSNLGKADNRRDGDRRSGQGDFIINVEEYKTSIYKTLGKHTDFMEEVYRQYNYYKWAFEKFESDYEALVDEISASARMNYLKVNNLGNGNNQNLHYYGSQTTLGSGQYSQTYLQTGDAKTYYANYVANMKTYIHTRSLWMSNNYTQTVSISGATVTVADQTYTGSALTPEVTVTAGGQTLVLGTDYTLSYSNNTNAGTATVTVSGKGKFNGSKTATFTIAPASIESATVTVADQLHTGSALTPAVTVVLGSTTLVSGTDYTVEYADNVEIGMASVTVTGKGNYTGTVAGSFEIYGISIEDAVVSAADQTYTGAALTPVVTVVLGDTTLVADTDYTVAYANNTNAGTATVTVTGKGNYMDSASGTFTIAPASIADAVVSAANQTYTGAAWTPEATVVLGEKTLVAGTDYTIAYTNNTNAGTATVTATGTGNYTGTASGTFTIAAASIASATVTAAGQTYTGSALTPAPTVVLGEKTLVSGTDYTVAYANNTNAGTATVTVTGKGNYTGTASTTFTIAAASIVSATVTAADQTYTGSAWTPAPTVVLGGTTLVSGTDYTVAYSNNTNAGSATVTVTGKGNYTGTASTTFTIAAASISSASVTAGSQTYNGAAQTPEATVKLGSKTLTEGVDYTLSYANNTNAGTATVTATGKGNYAGTASGSFTIAAASIASASVSAANQTYTGSALTPAPTVKLGSTTLASGTDYTVTYANNTNAGTATVTITGKGNYTGSASATFTIAAASIASASVSAANQTYTGSALTPAPTVVVNGKTLVSGTDYTVTYASNTNAGTATVTVTGKGNYTGTASTTFTIAAASIASASVSAANQTYNGSAQTPAPTVTLGGKTLVSGTDYTVSYSNNTNAGTATVTVTGKGNYTGTASTTFTIAAASISSATVTAAGQTYTGSALTPDATVKLGSKTLTEGVDYTVAYSNNTNAGTATVTVTGKGNYTGSASTTFTIAAASIASASVSAANQTYTGSALTPAPTVKLGSKTLASGTDYTVVYSNNTNVGTATVTVTGKGNYTGSASTTFSIAAASIANASVAASSQTYTGSALTPAPTVKLGSRTLTAGTDYTVAYANNTAVGTATITVTGKGNYTGTATGNFTIAAESIADATVTASNQTYTGSALTPTPTVKLGSKTLTEGVDYTVAYSNNTNAGTATVTVTGKGNYGGTASGTFTIAPASISSANVTAANQMYTGSALTPVPTVVLGSKTLVSGTDYTVAYTNNTNAGTATVTVTGKGNYTGSASTTFAIAAANIANATVTASNQTYNGSAQTPAPTVKLGSTTLVSGTDYTVAYANNTNAGTATVTVTGKGNYTGTATGTFTIAAASISSATVTAANQTYTGSALTPAPTVKLGSTTLVSGTDYTVAYSNNTNAGTATVTVTGKGNYTGSASTTFTIAAANIANATVTASNQTYNGSAQTPAPTVKLGSVTLSSGTDYTVAYSSNTNAGTATVTVTGKGNYTGTASGTFTIAAASITSAAVTAADQTYTGSALKPAPTVTLGGKTLTSGTDYTVAYTNNTNVGTATITVTGKGNYTGTAKGTFAITEVPKIDISAATVTAANQTYTGSALKPAPTVKLGSTTLASGTDYTVAYTNNTNAGTATITVTGKGNYTGTAKGTFTISPASIAAATVTAASQVYTGSALTPAPTVVVNGKTLVSGTDYTVAYANNTAIGTATITVTGKGNYTGTAKGSFEITEVPKVDIANATVTASQQNYTGSALTPAPTVRLGTVTLVADTDYTFSYANNVNAGTATITVIGKGDYTGTATGTFTILGISMTGASITAPRQSYTGSPLTPPVTVKLGSTTLVEGTDYTVAYANNVNVGTATVTVTGMGNYSGTATGTFIISEQQKIDLSSANVSAAQQTYTGSALTPAVTVTLGGKTLVAGTDYTVAYSNNINAGIAKVTVTGQGDYTGSSAGSFTIAAASIANATVTAADQTYTGSALTPAPTVTLAGKTLTAGTDYTVAYANNVNAGTATITVTGKGNYTGTAKGTFTITETAKIDISTATVTVADQTYTGSALKPTVTVKLGSKTLTAGTDYTVAYANNTNVGTARVTVTGKGDYAGTVTATFAIVHAPGWAYENGGYYFYEDDGTPRTEEWIEYDGKYYYLGTDGAVVKDGWAPYDGKWYYIKNYKVMKEGWATYQGKYYWIQDYQVLQEGWVQYNGSYYYIRNYQPVVDAWVSVDGSNYHFNAKGVCDRVA